MHTTKILVDDFDIIIDLLLRHKLNNKVNIHIPYYALGGGTLLSLYGNVINMIPHSLSSSINYNFIFFAINKYLEIICPMSILHNKGIKNYKKFADDKITNRIRDLVNNVIYIMIKNFIFKYGHNKDLNSFGINNLNPSIDNKIFELMDLLLKIVLIMILEN